MKVHGLGTEKENKSRGLLRGFVCLETDLATTAFFLAATLLSAAFFGAAFLLAGCPSSALLRATLLLGGFAAAHLFPSALLFRRGLFLAASGFLCGSRGFGFRAG